MKRLMLAVLFVLVGFSTARAEWRWIGPPAGSVDELTPDRSNAGLWFAVDDGVLYRSADAGRTWKPTGLRDIGRQGYYPVSGGAVTIVPATSDVIVTRKFGKAETQIWKSRDHGKTFQALSAVPFTLTGIIPHPTDSNILYGSALTGWGVVVSKDGGKTWTAFNNLPLPAEQHPGCSGPSVDESYVAVSPFHRSTVFVSGTISFICGPESDGEFFAFQSDNAGKSWTLSSAGPFFHSDPAFPDRLFTFGGNSLMVLTRNGWKNLPAPPILGQLVSVPRHPDELLALGFPYSVIRSTDAGNTWKPTPIDTKGRIRVLAALDDPFRGILAGTNGAGVYFRDETHDWIAVNTGIRNANISDVQGTASALYTLTARGFLYTSQDGGASWRLPFGLEGPQFSGMGVDPVNPGHVVVSGPGIQTSRDGGIHWTQAKLDASGGAVSSASAIDPTNSKIIYVAKGNSYGLFKSTDGGASFKSLPTRFASRGYQDVTRIVVDRNDGRIIYFVVPYFGIFKSADGGVTVKSAVNGISPPCPSCNSNPAIDLAPLAPRDAYLCVTQQGKLYRTHDAGEHWQLIGQGPLQSFVERLFSADGMGQHLYLIGGLLTGRLFESEDGGASWIERTREFGNTRNIRTLTDPRQAPLFAATDNGVYVRR